MPTHNAAARDGATNAVVGTGGALGASPRLKFRASPSSVGTPGTQLANLGITMGASSSGTSTGSGFVSDTNTAAGTVAFGSLDTSAGAVVVHFGVQATGGEVNMTNGLVLAAGDTVSCSSLTYTALPS